MLTRKLLILSFAICFSLSWLTLQVQAQVDVHEHEHAHEQHADGTLSLNNGEKWATDDALRRGMLEIRTAVAMLAPRFDAGELNQTQAHQLGEAVHGSVNTMIEQCQLPPEADANLHNILGKLLAGVTALESAPLSSAGLPALQEALETYGLYFDHVGWQEDEHAGHSH